MAVESELSIKKDIPMKTISISVILAFAVAAGASVGQAQAETVWHFPYKAAPYATQSAPPDRAKSVRAKRDGKQVRVRTHAKHK